MAGLVVIGYDGSADAQRAVEAAGPLDPDAALVVTVWQPSLTPSDTAIPLGGVALPYPEQDDEHEVVAAHQDRERARDRRKPGDHRGAGSPIVRREGAQLLRRAVQLGTRAA